MEEGKMGKRSECCIEDLQMANKPMKRYSSSGNLPHQGDAK